MKTTKIIIDMANLDLSIELSKLGGAQVMADKKNGGNVLVIPIEGAGLTLHKSGKVYLNCWLNERQSPSEFGETHTLKLVGKAPEQMTEQQLKAWHNSRYVGSGRPAKEQGYKANEEYNADNYQAAFPPQKEGNSDLLF